MRCLRRNCEADRSDAGQCAGCSLPLYCSEVCCASDEPEHKPACRASFQVEDFTDVKEGSRARVLGRGALGDVKLVVHKPTETYFALKTIEKEEAADQLPRLRREAFVHQRLTHPNIIRLYGCFEDLEHIYLVLEYADNGNLFSEIRKKKRLDEETARGLFRQVCRGVQYLHEKLIVHRDLKPENLLLTKKHEVKICDFEWCAEGLQSRQTFCGTIDYMAPEMILGEGHSFPVDVWALGVLLYEMLHGEAPWLGPKDVDKTEQILAAQYNCSEFLSPKVVDLIAQMLHPNPRKRPSSSQLFLHPWMALQSGAVSIGDTANYFLRGFGMTEGLITAVNEEFCTLFFEANGSYQQVAIAKLLSMQKGKAAKEQEVQQPKKAEVRPAAVLPVIPPQLRPEDEEEIFAKIEKWCQQPPKHPVKESVSIRELDESKRRLELSLAQLQECSSQEPRVYSAASESPTKAHLPPVVKAPPPPAWKEAAKWEPVEEEDEEESEDFTVVRRYQPPVVGVNSVLVRSRERELQQKLAKHQEELRQMAEELERPDLPKVKVSHEEKPQGVFGWFSNLFK